MNPFRDWPHPPPPTPPTHTRPTCPAVGFPRHSEKSFLLHNEAGADEDARAHCQGQADPEEHARLAASLRPSRRQARDVGAVRHVHKLTGPGARSYCRYGQVRDGRGTPFASLTSVQCAACLRGCARFLNTFAFQNGPRDEADPQSLTALLSVDDPLTNHRLLCNKEHHCGRFVRYSRRGK